MSDPLRRSAYLARPARRSPPRGPRLPQGAGLARARVAALAAKAAKRLARESEPLGQRSALACWLSELVSLTREHGHATIRHWCSEIRPDADLATAERHWERLKKTLVRLGVPHRRFVGENGVAAIALDIGPGEVDEYAARLATKFSRRKLVLRCCVVALLLQWAGDFARSV